MSVLNPIINKQFSLQPSKYNLNENKSSALASPSSVTFPSKQKSTKWGKLLGNSSVDSSDVSVKATVSRSLSARESLRESFQGRLSSSNSSNGGSGNKVFPKSANLLGNVGRQDTIEEDSERNMRSNKSIRDIANAEKQAITRDRLLAVFAEVDKNDKKTNESNNDKLQIPKQSRAEIESKEENYGSLQKDLLLTMLDIKVDLRLELQKIYHKVLRNEEILQDIVARLDFHMKDKVLTDEPSLSGKRDTVISLGDSAASTDLLEGAGGNGLGPLILKKRRGKIKKAPAPPKISSDQKPLLERKPSNTDKTASDDFV